MFETVRLNFTEDEFRSLALLCSRDFRSPAQELRWLLLRELERRSMLPAEEVKRLHAEKGGVKAEPK